MAWTVAFLALADVAINLVFAPPASADQPPGALAQFFDYGRSIEGKLRRMIGPDDSQTAPLAKAGWFTPLPQSGYDQPDSDERTRIAAYGMSFTFRICAIMQEMEETIALQNRGGPAAPLNHSLALYEFDADRLDADVVVLGVLASSVAAVHSMTHATWNFEAPAPYTCPLYMHDGESLARIEPRIASLNDLRAALRHPDQWQQWRDQLQQHDRFFNAFLFDQSWLDHSAICRMIRRALWQRHQRAILSQVHAPHGFNLKTQAIISAMTSRFVEQVRERGGRPIVLLIHDFGYADHLHRALRPTLLQLNVDHLSTHECIDAADPQNFLGDGHFTRPLEERVARELLDLIRRERP